MKPLREKLAQYTYPQEMRALGIYPYFTPICSEQNTEVYVTGVDHPVLMFGSNSYLGLTNDPRLKEAAKRLDFIQAAQYRDEIVRLQKELELK